MSRRGPVTRWITSLDLITVFLVVGCSSPSGSPRWSRRSV